jgi:sugar lactone lactonase YvrE
LGVVGLVLAASAAAQITSTAAGGYVGDGRLGTKASFGFPEFTVRDTAGNTYVADLISHRVRMVSTAGRISTFAGTGISGYNGDGIAATAAMLSFPTGLAIDGDGNIYIGDQGNNRVRKVDTSGNITTFAGNGVAGYSGDGKPATEASLHGPHALSFDTASGSLFISDVGNAVIRKVDASGIISTVAGNGTAGFGGDHGPATAASLNLPRGTVVDAVGNLYIADTGNSRVRRVSTKGIITTFAGNGSPGFSGNGGPATLAAIGFPKGLLIRNGQLLISNGGRSSFRSVSLASKIISSLAGSGAGFNGDGNPPLSTDFNSPTGMTLTSKGGLVVVDSGNGRVRTLGSMVKTTAGGYTGDGNIAATGSSLDDPENAAFDQAGNLYIAETLGNRIRKVDTTGHISTVAGTGLSGYSGDGGPAPSAELYLPYGVAADPFNNLFVADNGNGVIRKVDKSGNITTYVTDPNFTDLVSLATDSKGNLYSADDFACVVRKIGTGGTITVVAGMEFNCGYNGDELPATSAMLNGNFGVAVDSVGRIYIGDTLNHRVREVNLKGVISTVAGNGTCGFSGDGGPPTQAMLCNPSGVALDSSGRLYIADYLNLRVRAVYNGKMHTLAGTGVAGFNGNGLAATSTNLDGPITVAVDSQGNLYVTDDGSFRIRRVARPLLGLAAEGGAERSSPPESPRTRIVK